MATTVGIPEAERAGTGTSRERHWIRILVAVVVVLAGAVVALAIVATVDSESGGSEQQTAALDEVIDAWNRADGDAFAALFVENGVLSQYLFSELYPEPLFESKGRDAIAADISAYAGRGFRTWATSDVTVTGPFATRTGAWEADGTRGGTGILVMQVRDDGRIEHLWAFSQEKP